MVFSQGKLIVGEIFIGQHFRQYYKPKFRHFSPLNFSSIRYKDNMLNNNSSRCVKESNDEQKISFIMTNENEKVIIGMAKFVFK